MRVRWFGEPWPSAEEPAPVCDDDAYRVSTPEGYRCIYCKQEIIDIDRGVVMPWSGHWRDGYTFSFIGNDTEGMDLIVCAQHLHCFLDAIGTPHDLEEPYAITLTRYHPPRADCTGVFEWDAAHPGVCPGCGR